MKHNRRIPPRVLKRILKDPNRLVGTYWTLGGNLVPYKILDVAKTCGEIHVSAINNALQSRTFYLEEIVGGSSNWAYEGVDLAWASPGKFVKSVEVEEGEEYIYRVVTWGLYEAVLWLNPETNTYEYPEPDLNCTSLTTSANVLINGRIRGVAEPVSETFMDSTVHVIMSALESHTKQLNKWAADYIHTRSTPTSRQEASLQARWFLLNLQRILEQEESLEDILRILDEHKSQPPVSSDIISPDVPTKSALDRLLEDEPE